MKKYYDVLLSEPELSLFSELQERLYTSKHTKAVRDAYLIKKFETEPGLLSKILFDKKTNKANSVYKARQILKSIDNPGKGSELRRRYDSFNINQKINYKNTDGLRADIVDAFQDSSKRIQGWRKTPGRQLYDHPQSGNIGGYGDRPIGYIKRAMR